jgi:RNA polymerase sigma factor (sigma-70 family)
LAAFIERVVSFGENASMADATSPTLVQYIRRLAGDPVDGDVTDSKLLERFVRRHEEAAFTALVGRHGALVWGVCWRVLRQAEDAEDAFQATFLVLARKAPSIPWHESIAPWLYDVAYRLAMKTKHKTASRFVHEKQAAMLPKAQSVPESACQEISNLVDGELQRLPAKYRTPLLLCSVEGQTRDQAARQLGLSLRTLDRRLESGRELLRMRFLRRGLTLSAALLATDLSRHLASAAMPMHLIAHTGKAGFAFASGPVAFGMRISNQAITLAEGVVRAMSLTRASIAGTILLAVSLIGTTGGLLAYASLATEKAPKPEASALLPDKAPEASQQREDPNTETKDLGESKKRLLKLGIAMHRYHEVYNQFPPAALVGKEGKPLLSWRVLVLPYLEQDNLFKQFKLDEPWDSPNNRKCPRFMSLCERKAKNHLSRSIRS